VNIDNQFIFVALSCIGVLIVLGLSVNAFFIRGLVEKISLLQMQSATLIEKAGSSESRITESEKSHNLTREAMHQIRTDLGQRIIKLEMRVFET
jgi:hypothetical protein